VFIKSKIRGNIQDLKYSVHSPLFSPTKNTTCNNEGKIIFFKNMNFRHLSQINIKKAYIIHYRFKTIEEFIYKYKRGYNNWFGSRINKFLKELIQEFFRMNKITIKKINYIENELNLNLSEYKKKLKK